MTNIERDALLLNLVTSINNIQNTLNDFRKENKKEHEDLRAEIKAVDLKVDRTAEELRAEIKASEDRTKKELRAEMKSTAEELRAEIKQVAKNASIELEAKMDENAIATAEIIHDIGAYQKRIIEKLNEHDTEILEIKTKLA